MPQVFPLSAEREVSRVRTVTREEAEALLGVSLSQFDLLERWDVHFPQRMDGEDSEALYDRRAISGYRERIACVLDAFQKGRKGNGAVVTAETERVYTIGEMATRLGISAKTLQRWSRMETDPLRGAMAVVLRRLTMVLTADHVRAFGRAHPGVVEFAHSFRRTTLQERQELIARAEVLAQQRQVPAAITRVLAEQTGRSPSTIRSTLKSHAQTHPESSLRVIIAQESEKRALGLSIEYIPNEEFAAIGSNTKREKAILGPAPRNGEIPQETRASRRSGKRTRNQDPYLETLYDAGAPLLTRAEEVHLFRKMNFLKYRACTLQSELQALAGDIGKWRKRRALAGQILAFHRESETVRNAILNANLRLVVSVSKKYVQEGFTRHDLVSDGNISLMRAVEKFDFARGNKFSTYASWAIVKNFYRSIPLEKRTRGRFFELSTDSGNDGRYSEPVDTRADPLERETQRRKQQGELEKLLAHLDEREQRIMRMRFGFGEGAEPHTLKQIGAMIGLTKERVRQIEARARGKMGRAAEELDMTIEADDDL